MSIVLARNYGRLGNVLFQVAAAVVYALKHDLDLSVQRVTNDNYWNPLYFQNLVNSNWVDGREDVLINETGFRYAEIEFREEWRGNQIVLNGYFQSYLHVEGYRDQLLYLLDLPYSKKENYVSVHIRRGDYLHLRNKHPEVTNQWYEEQMNKFHGFKFKFFSDDIKYCKEAFAHRKDCEFSTNNTEMEDLIEASCCAHNICSASTFSYWIAYLNRNKDKQCIFPKLWFVEGYSLDPQDLLHPDFIKA